MAKELGSIKEKINILINAIRSTQDNTLKPYIKEDLQSVEDFISQCGRYIDRVTAMEAALQTARFRMETKDYQNFIQDLDRSRKWEHDALIAATKLINRFCRLYSVESIFTGNLDSRIAIAEFAMEVVKAYFQERKL